MQYAGSLCQGQRAGYYSQAAFPGDVGVSQCSILGRNQSSEQENLTPSVEGERERERKREEKRKIKIQKVIIKQ